MNTSTLKKTAISGFVGMTIMTQAMGSAFAFEPVGELCLNPGGCPTNPAFEGGGFAPNPPAGPNPPAPPAGPNWGGIGGMFVGAAIGGALVNGLNKKPQTVYVQPQPQPTYVQPVSAGNPHIAYCMSKFKTYDIPTNSYMSYSGVRKQCISQYM